MPARHLNAVPAPDASFDACADAGTDLIDLIRDAAALRNDPHATELDWLVWYEDKAALLSAIAALTGSREVSTLAVEAWAEVDARRALLDLDPHELDDTGSTGGASGRW